MTRGRGPDRDTILAASRGGVITARTLVALGVPESTVYHRCRDGGPWQRLAPGVVLLCTGQPTADQLVIAALLHGGEQAVLTGLEACRRHRIRRGPTAGGSLQLLVPHTRQACCSRETWDFSLMMRSGRRNATGWKRHPRGALPQSSPRSASDGSGKDGNGSCARAVGP